MNDEEEKKHDLNSSDGLADFFSDVDDEDLIDGEYDDVDQIIDEVMALLENYGPMTGGIITFTTIYNYLQQGNHPNLTQGQGFDVIARMRTNKVILDEITYSEFPDLYIYIFQDVQLTEDMKGLIKLFAESNAQEISALKERTHWEEQILEKTIHQLIEMSILKFEEKIYSIPAFSL